MSVTLTHALLMRCAALSLLLIVMLGMPTDSYAQETSCDTGAALQHTFKSGASWSLCAHVSGVHGLEISNAFYQAPGDFKRSVMAQAQLSQILLHYHDRTVAEPQIVPTVIVADESENLQTAIALNNENCDGLVLGTQLAPESICQRIKGQGIFSRFDELRAARTESWELSSTLIREALTWNVAWTFTEDGQIQPRLSLSGRSTRRNTQEQFAQQARTDIPAMTRATLLATWRLVPALDTEAKDSIEQFDFPLDVVNGNRRPMIITPLVVETFKPMDRGNFRGWRILDESQAGYYIDPANNGYSFASSEHNWANYAVAVTKDSNCERYASNNLTSFEATTCGANLDDFVNNEPLTGANIALWFSQTRPIDPSVEDWPVIRDVQLGFDLLPFDWTDKSPFELVE